MTQLDSDTLLKNINGALKSKKLYPAGHPATIAPARKAYQFVTEFLKTKNTLAIGRVNDLLVFESSPVADSDRLYPELSLYMADKNVDALMFEKGVTERELSALFEILSGEQLHGPALQKELYAKGVTHVTLKSIAMARNTDQLLDLKREVRDRYGPFPLAVKKLLTLLELKLLAKSALVSDSLY
jgi:hypothetical protein